MQSLLQEIRQSAEAEDAHGGAFGGKFILSVHRIATGIFSLKFFIEKRF